MKNEDFSNENKGFVKREKGGFNWEMDDEEGKMEREERIRGRKASDGVNRSKEIGGN